MVLYILIISVLVLLQCKFSGGWGGLGRRVVMQGSGHKQLWNSKKLQEIDYFPHSDYINACINVSLYVCGGLVGVGDARKVE